MRKFLHISLQTLGIVFLLVGLFCFYNVLVVWKLEHTILAAGVTYGILNLLLSIGFLFRQSWIYTGLLINFLATAGLIAVEVPFNKSMDVTHISLAVGIAGTLTLLAYASRVLLKKGRGENIIIGGIFILLRLGVLCYTVAVVFL